MLSYTCSCARSFYVRLSVICHHVLSVHRLGNKSSCFTPVLDVAFNVYCYYKIINRIISVFTYCQFDHVNVCIILYGNTNKRVSLSILLHGVLYCWRWMANIKANKPSSINRCVRSIPYRRLHTLTPQRLRPLYPLGCADAWRFPTFVNCQMSSDL